MLNLSNWAHQLDAETVTLKFRLLTIIISLAAFMNSCFLKQDRTTVVYGTITDQNGQPVDSILVTVDATQFLNRISVALVYSDSNGKYELIFDVPKKYSSVDVVVPFGLVDNPKYDKNYQGKSVKKNGTSTNNCCHAEIGQKTQYDFQLIPK